MPLYEFRCPDCPDVDYTAFRQGGPPDTPPLCPTHDTALKRRFSFTTTIMFQPFDDPQTGRYIESPRHHRQVLRELSEEMTQRTGMLHDYVPVHPADMKDAAGVTDEGMDSLYRRSTAEGRREVKLYL